MDRKKIRRKLIIKKYIFELLQLTFGTIIMAIGISQFLLPNKLSSGGFSGLATIPYYLFNWPVGRTVLILNIPFFILAFIRIGKVFFVKTLIGTVLLSLFIDFYKLFYGGSKFLNNPVRRKQFHFCSHITKPSDQLKLT